MIISKRHFSSISEITEEEIKSYAEMIQIITVKYDNLLNIIPLFRRNSSSKLMV